MKSKFKFPMLKAERALCCVYIPIHVALRLLVVFALGAAGLSLSPVYISLIWYTLSFVFVLMIAFRFLRKSFSDLLDGIIRTLQSVILGYAFFYAMVFLASLALRQLTADIINPNTDELLSLYRQSPSVMSIVLLVLAPIIEETLFRGALFGSIRQKSRILAYIISALLFAVYHVWRFAIIDFPPVLLLFSLEYIVASIALAWCYEHSGTIWAPILLHAVINFISTRGL